MGDPLLPVSDSGQVTKIGGFFRCRSVQKLCTHVLIEILFRHRGRMCELTDHVKGFVFPSVAVNVDGSVFGRTAGGRETRDDSVTDKTQVMIAAPVGVDNIIGVKDEDPLPP